MGKKIGIDLGTTYSCVAFLNDLGGLEVVKNMEGNNTTPSIVFFDQGGSSVVVGEQARPSAVFEPDNLVERIKSQMGTKDFTINVAGTDYSPTAISSIILRKLKEDAEAYFNDTIEGCVITCPAYFGTIAKSATLKAAEEAGLNVYQIINEPTAAAFAYAYIKNEDVNKTVLIYDLGGGTFDCTLLKMEFVGDTKKLNAIASNGDPFLGGKDWDNALRDYVVEEFCRETGTDEEEMKADPECMTELSETIEKTKKQLTAREVVKVPVNYQGNKQVIEVSRDTFDSITEPLLQKTISLVNDMLNKENMTIDAVDEIILVGGSTYMPQVSKCLEANYGKPMASFEPNEAVAKGAALMAALAYNYDSNMEGGESSGEETADVGEVSAQPASAGGEIQVGKKKFVVEDIINKSYGVKIRAGEELLLANLLKSGTPKPCSGVNTDLIFEGEPLTLVIGGATEITVGESDSKEDVIAWDDSYNVYTGPLNVPAGLDPDTPVEVVFDLDASGILSIKTVANGIETHLVFDPSTGSASTEGIEQAKKVQLC